MKRFLSILFLAAFATTASALLWIQPSRFASAGGASSLLTDLAAYWKLDETSGNRADSSGNGTILTDTNTVLYAAGKQGNAADFEEDNNERLTAASNSSIALSNDQALTIACWVYRESDSGFDIGIVAKNANSDHTDEYVLSDYSAGSGKYRFKVGNGTSSTTVDSTTAPTNGAWHLVIAWHDPTADKLYISVNNETPAQATWTGGTYVGTSQLTIGGMTFNAGINYDGLIDEVGIWKRVLTADERTTLYNSGSGTTYPF
jgi:hypothetical protein